MQASDDHGIAAAQRESDAFEVARSRRALRKGESDVAWRLRKSWLTLRARLLHPRASSDIQPVQAHNDLFFAELGVSRSDATQLCTETLAAVESEFRPRKQSIHYLAFAALRASGFAPREILEVGTYRGETTRYLAKLFPEARIFTIELPDDDPLIAEYHPDKERSSRVESELRSLPNVTPVRINTVDLQKQNFPLFDLVWLDGAHYFPEVAWDHFFCLDHLAPGGWLFSDDLILPGNPFHRRPEHLDLYRVFEYISARRKQPVGLLIKREDPLRFQVRPKYVAYLRNDGSECQ